MNVERNKNAKYKTHEKHELTNKIIIPWFHYINNKIYTETIKQIQLPVKNTHYRFRCVFFIQVRCFLILVLFYFSFIWVHVYACAFKSMVCWGSAFEPGACRLPYYYTPPVCVSAVIGALAVRRQNTHTQKACILGMVYCGSASARRFRASLLVQTTCVRSCCTWRASCVAA